MEFSKLKLNQGPRQAHHFSAEEFTNLKSSLFRTNKKTKENNMNIANSLLKKCTNNKDDVKRYKFLKKVLFPITKIQRHESLYSKGYNNNINPRSYSLQRGDKKCKGGCIFDIVLFNYLYKDRRNSKRVECKNNEELISLSNIRKRHNNKTKLILKELIPTKDLLWNYTFELQQHVIDLNTQLEKVKKESVESIALSTKIKREAELLKQDLEYQIEELTRELHNKELEVQNLKYSTNNIKQPNVEIMSDDIIEDYPLQRQERNRHKEITKETPESILDEIEKMIVPSAELKILLTNDTEESYSLLKELNEALKSQVKQLLEEKKEIADLAKRNIELVTEEKTILEQRIHELVSGMEESQLMLENEELERTKAGIEIEQRTLYSKKSAFNRKLEKVRETQEQLEKKEKGLKEWDMRIKVKQKKLFFKKQALEKEWINLDDQKEKLATDIKDIEYEWMTVIALKDKLVKAGKKIARINQNLKEKQQGVNE